MLHILLYMYSMHLYYVYIYVCVFVCIYVYTYVCMYACKMYVFRSRAWPYTPIKYMHFCKDTLWISLDKNHQIKSLVGLFKFYFMCTLK